MSETPTAPARTPTAPAHPAGTGLRMLNAVIALLAVLALIYHSATMGYSLWTGWYNRVVSLSSTWAVAGLVCVHVLIVLVLYFFFAEDHGLAYDREPRSILIQRGTAIAIIILLHFHIVAYQAVAMGHKLDGWMAFVDISTELLFFACVSAHVAVSLVPALVRLHWVRRPAAIKVGDKVTYVVCAVCFVVYTLGMLHFYLGAIA